MGRSDRKPSSPLACLLSGQGYTIWPRYLFKDFTNEEVSAEGEAVAVEFFQDEPWVLHHFLGQEEVKTFIPGSEDDGEFCGGPALEPCPRPPSGS